MIICFNINEPYSIYVPWGTQPTIEWFGCKGSSTVILSGEPTIIINGRPTTIKVWKITIHPFNMLCSGTLKLCNREWHFSTFTARNK